MTESQQNKAFTIYNASAGSGKTFTLVRDYLFILFQSNSHDFFRNILAITFTNKAVAEMKSRIVENLIAFSQPIVPDESLDMLNALMSKTNLSKRQIQAKAEHILKTLIHNYASFEVSTIDGFTHRVLRTFSRDLGLPGNFEVSMQVDELLIEAVDRVIAKAGEDKLLTKTLINFVLNQADEDKSWDVSTNLYAIAKLLINENNLQHLAYLESKSLDDFERFSKELSEQQKSLETKIAHTAKAVFKLLQNAGINPEYAFTGKYGFKYFTKLIDGHYHGINLSASWQANLSDSSKTIYSKSSKELSKDQKAILNGLQEDIALLFKQSKDYILQISFIERISKNLTALSLLNTINVELDAIKKERSLVLISDFNKTIAETIKDQPAPFIYERLGERYRHFFIDEFQDTSVLQWHNLIPLVENALTSLDTEGEQGSLLVVGDAKQSIYRWRGGKAEQFIGLYNGLSPFPVETDIKNLPKNYRSFREIVNFNNALFNHLATHFEADVYKALYKASHQDATKDKAGYVNLSFFDVANKDEEHQVFPERVLEIIEASIKLNYSKKDICILTRNRKEGIVIANYLSAKGVPIISSETLLISNSPEVNCIINVLQLVENPSDDLSKVELLEFILETKAAIESPTAILLSFLQKTTPEFFQDLEEFQVTFNLNTFRSLPFYDAIAYVVKSFQLEPSSNAYVHYFLDFVFNYTAQHLSGVKGFLQHWKQHKNKLSILVPEGQDAVQLLTVHRSKGLEFPIVIYPYANDNLTDFKLDSLWIDVPQPLNNIPKAYISASKSLLDLDDAAAVPFQQLAQEKQIDAINVLYVALTRAKEQLYILGNNELSKGVPNLNKISGLLIDFLQKQNLWSDNKLTYEFGATQPKMVKEHTLALANNHQSLTTASFEDRAITLATNSGRLWGTSAAEALDEGILVHDIMSKIDTTQDVESVLKNFKSCGKIPQSREKEISKKIWNIVQHKELSPYFASNSTNLNERDIVASNGDILRPDRINFINDDEVVIIDYKTGLFNERHVAQIHQYAQAFSEMGYTVTKQILIYTNNELDVKNV